MSCFIPQDELEQALYDTFLDDFLTSAPLEE